MESTPDSTFSTSTSKSNDAFQNAIACSILIPDLPFVYTDSLLTTLLAFFDSIEGGVFGVIPYVNLFEICIDHIKILRKRENIFGSDSVSFVQWLLG